MVRSNGNSRRRSGLYGKATHALHYCPCHQALHVTPAMEAGVSEHVRMPEEIVSSLP